MFTEEIQKRIDNAFTDLETSFALIKVSANGEEDVWRGLLEENINSLEDCAKKCVENTQKFLDLRRFEK